MDLENGDAPERCPIFFCEGGSKVISKMEESRGGKGTGGCEKHSEMLVRVMSEEMK